MIVRDATPSDYLAIIEMGEEFAKAAGQPEVDTVAAFKIIESLPILKVSENGLVCGMAAAMVYPHYWNPEVLVAQELWWWVKEEARGTGAGIQLLDALEQAAKEAGAAKLMMLCLDDLRPDVLEKLYRRRGYKPQERIFVKDFL